MTSPEGILALRDVAAEAGVSKYTGRQSGTGACELEGLGLGARLQALQDQGLIHQRPQERVGLCPWGGG